MFKSLAKLKNAKIKSESIKESKHTGTLDIGGRIKITKGCISGEVSYWARVCESIYPDFIVADDWEDEGLNYVTISGVEIDSIEKFKQGLIAHGMDSVAKTVDISNEEITAEIYKDMVSHPSIKVLFGDKKLLNALSKEEKQDASIKLFISRYEEEKPPMYLLQNNGVVNSSYVGKPTIEQLLQFKKDRVMIVNEEIKTEE